MFPKCNLENVIAHTHPLYLPLSAADDSEISGPIRFKSYYAVATFSDSKSKFSFAEGALVQVISKDPTGIDG